MNDYKNHIAQEIGNVWALARGLEKELIQVEPKDGDSAVCLDAAMAISFMLTDLLETLKKYAYEA